MSVMQHDGTWRATLGVNFNSACYAAANDEVWAYMLTSAGTAQWKLFDVFYRARGSQTSLRVADVFDYYVPEYDHSSIRLLPDFDTGFSSVNIFGGADPYPEDYDVVMSGLDSEPGDKEFVAAMPDYLDPPLDAGVALAANEHIFDLLTARWRGNSLLRGFMDMYPIYNPDKEYRSATAGPLFIQEYKRHVVPASWAPVCHVLLTELKHIPVGPIEQGAEGVNITPRPLVPPGDGMVGGVDGDTSDLRGQRTVPDVQMEQLMSLLSALTPAQRAKLLTGGSVSEGKKED